MVSRWYTTCRYDLSDQLAILSLTAPFNGLAFWRFPIKPKVNSLDGELSNVGEVLLIFTSNGAVYDMLY